MHLAGIPCIITRLSFPCLNSQKNSGIPWTRVSRGQGGPPWLVNAVTYSSCTRDACLCPRLALVETGVAFGTGLGAGAVFFHACWAGHTRGVLSVRAAHAIFVGLLADPAEPLVPEAGPRAVGAPGRRILWTRDELAGPTYQFLPSARDTRRRLSIGLVCSRKAGGATRLTSDRLV